MNNQNIMQLVDRNIYLYGEIDDTTALEVVSHINHINEIDDMEEEAFVEKIGTFVESGFLKPDSLRGLQAREPIYIEINSNGGSSPSGFSIITAIQNSETPVIGYVTGNCMSMAIPILASCDYKIGSEYSKFMIHDVYSASEGKFNDLNSSIEYIGSVREDYIKATAKNTKMTESEVREITNRNSDYFFSPEKAFDLGLIDHIDNNKIDEEEMMNKIYGLHEVEGIPVEEEVEEDSGSRAFEKEAPKESDVNLSELVDEIVEQRAENRKKEKNKESQSIEIKASDLVNYNIRVSEDESIPFNVKSKDGVRYTIDEEGNVNLDIDSKLEEGFISRAFKSILDIIKG